MILFYYLIDLIAETKPLKFPSFSALTEPNGFLVGAGVVAANFSNTLKVSSTFPSTLIRAVSRVAIFAASSSLAARSASNC